MKAKAKNATLIQEIWSTSQGLSLYRFKIFKIQKILLETWLAILQTHSSQNKQKLSNVFGSKKSPYYLCLLPFSKIAAVCDNKGDTFSSSELNSCVHMQWNRKPRQQTCLSVRIQFIGFFNTKRLSWYSHLCNRGFVSCRFTLTIPQSKKSPQFYAFFKGMVEVTGYFNY